MKTFNDLFDCWPSIASFATSTGLDRKHCGVMKIRQKIHSRYWKRIIDGARAEAERCRQSGDLERARRLDRITAEELLNLQEIARKAKGRRARKIAA